MSGEGTTWVVSARRSSPHQLHRMLHQVVQHGEPVPHAAGAAGEVHDQGLAADAGEAAGKGGPREAGEGAHPERLGDAGCFLLENGAGGFGGDVAVGEAGAAGGEDDVRVVAVGPLSEGGRDPAGLIGHERALGHGVAALLGPGGDEIAGGVAPLAAAAGVGDGEDGKADGHRPESWIEGRYDFPMGL